MNYAQHKLSQLYYRLDSRHDEAKSLNRRLTELNKEIEAYTALFAEAEQEGSFYHKAMESLNPVYELIKETEKHIKGEGSKVVKEANIALPLLIESYKKFHNDETIDLSHNARYELKHIAEFIADVDSGEAWTGKGWKVKNREMLKHQLMRLRENLDQTPYKVITERAEELMKEGV